MNPVYLTQPLKTWTTATSTTKTLCRRSPTLQLLPLLSWIKTQFCRQAQFKCPKRPTIHLNWSLRWTNTTTIWVCWCNLQKCRMRMSARVQFALTKQAKLKSGKKVSLGNLTPVRFPHNLKTSLSSHAKWKWAWSTTTASGKCTSLKRLKTRPHSLW